MENAELEMLSHAVFFPCCIIKSISAVSSVQCFYSSLMGSRGYSASCLAPRFSLDNDDGVFSAGCTDDRL